MARLTRHVRAGLIAGVLLAATVVATSPAGAATGPPPAPWAQGDFNAARSAFNPNETLISKASVGGLAWSRSYVARPADPSGAGCGAGVATPPVAVGNRLYAVMSQRLVAYNLANGRKVWSTPLDTDSWTTDYTSVSVASGRVVLTELDCISQSDPAGFVSTYRVSDGTQLYRVWLDPSPQSIVVTGGLVIYSGFEAGGGDVAALNLSDGSTAWRNDLPCWGGNDLAVVAGLAIVAACDPTDESLTRLEAHDIATGAVVWSRPGDWQVFRGDTDTVSGHDVYVANPAGRITDLDPLTGATRWSKAGLGSSVAAVAKSYLYTFCADYTLCAVSRASGAIAWTQTATPGPVGVANGLVFVGGAWTPVMSAKDGSTVPVGLGEGYPWNESSNTLAIANGRVITTTDRIIDVYQVPRPQ